MKRRSKKERVPFFHTRFNFYTKSYISSERFRVTHKSRQWLKTNDTIFPKIELFLRISLKTDNRILDALVRIYLWRFVYNQLSIQTKKMFPRHRFNLRKSLISFCYIHHIHYSCCRWRNISNYSIENILIERGNQPDNNIICCAVCDTLTFLLPA